MDNLYDFTTTLKSAWASRNDEDLICDYWDMDGRAIELISAATYKVISTGERVKLKPTAEIYGCYRK